MSQAAGRAGGRGDESTLTALSCLAVTLWIRCPACAWRASTPRAGLLLDFAGDAVTIDCGQAHVKAPYTVENATSALIVHVQNSGGSFDLDRLLRQERCAAREAPQSTASWSPAMNGDDITFTPHSESCAVASFTPQTGAGSTTMVAANMLLPAPASLCHLRPRQMSQLSRLRPRSNPHPAPPAG